MLLFTKPGCDKCDWVKANLPAGAAVTTHDILTAEGLAELAFRELVTVAERQLPILVTPAGAVVTGAIRIRDTLAGAC
jgi:hypothetical protein